VFSLRFNSVIIRPDIVGALLNWFQRIGSRLYGCLFCDAFLKLEINDCFGAFTLDNFPPEGDVSCEGFPCRQAGFSLVHLMLSKEESELLVEEIKSAWLAAMVNEQELTSITCRLVSCLLKFTLPDQAFQLLPDCVPAPDARNGSSSRSSYGPPTPELFSN
jgi:hypothetical protein